MIFVGHWILYFALKMSVQSGFLCRRHLLELKIKLIKLKNGILTGFNSLIFGPDIELLHSLFHWFNTRTQRPNSNVLNHHFFAVILTINGHQVITGFFSRTFIDSCACFRIDFEATKYVKMVLRKPILKNKFQMTKKCESLHANVFYVTQTIKKKLFERTSLNFERINRCCL